MLLTASISQTDRQRRTKFGDLLREFQQRQTSAAVSAITGIAGIAIATEMVASRWDIRATKETRPVKKWCKHYLYIRIRE